MPGWLVRVLKGGDKVSTRTIPDRDGKSILVDLKVGETPGLISALARLSEESANTRRACYCSPYVHHVAKQRREGSFCGYRNTQMLISYIRNTQVSGYQHFHGESIPSIFRLQEMIEQAWDNGFNSSSREEVGQLQMTRKFIGTSEVEAILLSLDIPVATRAFVSTKQTAALELLTDYVASYFELTKSDGKVFVGQKPPLFFQRRGHSMTIVGIHEDIHGIRSLIIFDPRYKPSGKLKQLALSQTMPTNVDKVLGAHLYGAACLAQYDAFELVRLTSNETTPNPVK